MLNNPLGINYFQKLETNKNLHLQNFKKLTYKSPSPAQRIYFREKLLVVPESLNGFEKEVSNLALYEKFALICHAIEKLQMSLFHTQKNSQNYTHLQPEAVRIRTYCTIFSFKLLLTQCKDNFLLCFRLSLLLSE